MSLIYKPRICFTQCVITLFPEDAADVCVCVFASQAAAETSWAFNTFNSISLQKLQRNSVITHHLNSLTSRTFSLSRLLSSASDIVVLVCRTVWNLEFVLCLYFSSCCSLIEFRPSNLLLETSPVRLQSDDNVTKLFQVLKKHQL